MPEVNPLEMRRGIYFEEYSVGQTVVTPGRTVTEADILSFAAMSGDWNPLHTDAVAAAQGPFGQRVAHGLWALSAAVGLVVRLGFMDDTLLAFRELLHWKFSLPIFIGDTLHVRASIGAVRPVPRLGGGMITLHVEILNQNSEIVQHGEWTALVKSIPGQGPAEYK